MKQSPSIDTTRATKGITTSSNLVMENHKIAQRVGDNMGGSKGIIKAKSRLRVKIKSNDPMLHKKRIKKKKQKFNVFEYFLHEI